MNDGDRGSTDTGIKQQQHKHSCGGGDEEVVVMGLIVILGALCEKHFAPSSLAFHKLPVINRMAITYFHSF